jgi:hypothetical protein
MARLSTVPLRQSQELIKLKARDDRGPRGTQKPNTIGIAKRAPFQSQGNMSCRPDFCSSRDVYHMNPYSASQTPAHGAKENPAHNGSIKGGRRSGLIAATRWARSRYFLPRQSVRNSSSGLHQATDDLRTSTTLLYPKRLPPMVLRRACVPRNDGSDCYRLVNVGGRFLEIAGRPRGQP